MLNGVLMWFISSFVIFLKWKNLDGDSIEIRLIDPQVQGRIWQSKHDYVSKGDVQREKWE